MYQYYIWLIYIQYIQYVEGTYPQRWVAYVYISPTTKLFSILNLCFHNPPLSFYIVQIFFCGIILKTPNLMVQTMILGKEIHEWHMIAKIHQVNGNERCGNLIELMAWWDNFVCSGPKDMAKHFYTYYVYDGNFDTSWVGKEVQRLLEYK